MSDRSCFEVKLFGGILFKDYWNLKDNPLFVRLDKKSKPYFYFQELPCSTCEKIDSLSTLSNYLKKSDWVFIPKYWDYLSIGLQAMINIPKTG